MNPTRSRCPEKNFEIFSIAFIIVPLLFQAVLFVPDKMYKLLFLAYEVITISFIDIKRHKCH